MKIEYPNKDARITITDKEEAKTLVNELMEKDISFHYNVGLDGDVFWVWIHKDNVQLLGKVR